MRVFLREMDRSRRVDNARVSDRQNRTSGRGDIDSQSRRKNEKIHGNPWIHIRNPRISDQILFTRRAGKAILLLISIMILLILLLIFKTNSIET